MATALALTGATSVAFAGGFDRGSQSVMVIFEEGTYFETTAAYVDPDLEGDNANGSSSVGSVGDDFSFFSAAFKFDISDNLAAALIFNEPIGSDLAYDSSDPSFGGTRVDADSLGIAGILKYSMHNGVSVYGGARRVRIGGDVTLSGNGYFPLSQPSGALGPGSPGGDYTAKISDEWGTGYIIGAAYEMPEIALRVAATYHSDIKFEATIEEDGPLIPTGIAGVPPQPLLDRRSQEDGELPERWQLEAQTGIAPNTLLTAEVLYVPHSDVDISPEGFSTLTGRSLTTFGDTTYYELGLGHRFTDMIAGSVEAFYEHNDDDDNTPLTVTNSYWGLGIGGSFDLTERFTVGIGVRHLWFEDVTVGLDNPVFGRQEMRFDNGTAWAGGVKLGVNF